MFLPAMPSVEGINTFQPSDSYNTVFGTPTPVSAPLYQSRTFSAEINSPGNEGYRELITGSPPRGWMGFPLHIPGNPATGAVTFSAIHSATSNIQARVNVSTSGVAHAYIGAGTQQNGITLAALTFYWCEMIYNVSNATHSLFWRLNGADQPTATVAAVGSDSVDYGQLVSLTGNGTLTWHVGAYWAWGSASADNDWLGEPTDFGAANNPPLGVSGRGAGW